MTQATSEVKRKAVLAKSAARVLAVLSTEQKNLALRSMVQALRDKKEIIIQANELDLKAAKSKGISSALLDRLTLNDKRIEDMAEGLEEVAKLPDPIGEVTHMWRQPNGLEIGKVRVPLGVIGIIYEARPNVTVDAAGLCLKAGNAVVLRGGSEAINSNKAIVEVIEKAALTNGLPAGSINLIEDTDRAAANELMRLNGLIDVLIPRGGAGLIKAVIENATVPVIETGVGNCHLYVDSSADLAMAERIIINAKTQRPGVCNAIETLLVHKSVASRILPSIGEKLREKGVEIRGCELSREYIPYVFPATEEDWATEYLDLIIAVKVVDSVQEAIDHIDMYGSKHSEAIVTMDYQAARKFQKEVDAACVYVNASTRFTDGFQFGFGAEIGISTQKLHARGPMGLRELTSTKYLIYGDGQIRE
jgi:glutamate-5-semialdehyde dehydrogenase